MENYLYQENQKVHPLMIVVLILPVFVILGVIFFPEFFDDKNEPPFVKNLVLGLIIVIEIFILYNFYQLKIRLNNDFLQFSFGWFKKKIPIFEIKECLIQDYKLGRYGGYGIRIGFDKSIGYVARGGRGVKINTSKKNYFISTDRPEELSGILKNLIRK